MNPSEKEIEFDFENFLISIGAMLIDSIEVNNFLGSGVYNRKFYKLEKNKKCFYFDFCVSCPDGSKEYDDFGIYQDEQCKKIKNFLDARFLFENDNHIFDFLGSDYPDSKELAEQLIARVI